MTTAAIIAAIETIIDEAARMKNAYFWTPPGSAAGRRWYEEKHTCPPVEWSEGGHTYSAAYDVRCTCRNIYARGEYTRDGKKTTLTAIKNSLARLQAATA